MKKNKYAKAYMSLLKLRFHPLRAARDLYHIHCQLQVEASIAGKSNYFTAFRLTLLPGSNAGSSGNALLSWSHPMPSIIRSKKRRLVKSALLETR